MSTLISGLLLLGVLLCAPFRAESQSMKDIAATPIAQEQRETFNSHWYRPYFHFTPPTGWMNDPNGLVFLQGVWHHFYQSSPLREDGSPMGFNTRGWGHAVSRDLVHWRHRPLAVEPSKDYGGAWSGSGFVDERDVLGLRAPGGPPTLCLFFTASRANAQYLAYSTDGGLNFVLHPDNPVVPTLPQQPDVRGAADRDPKVLYHEPSGNYVMVLFYSKHDPQGFLFLVSKNLLDWEQTHFLPGYFECPDFFELPVQDRPGESRWVLVDGDGSYQLGTFDGRVFEPEGAKQSLVSGNYSATQTWNNAPEGRRVQTAWMRWRGPTSERFPGMPFNQMQAIPCDVTLHAHAEGIRARRAPVPELEVLRGEPLLQWRGRELSTDQDLELPGDHFDLIIELDPTVGDGQLTLAYQGVETIILVQDGRAEIAGPGGSLKVRLAENDSLRLRILIDRNAVEFFAQDGAQSRVSTFLADPDASGQLKLTATGAVRAKTLDIYPMRPYWNEPGTP